MTAIATSSTLKLDGRSEIETYLNETKSFSVSSPLSTPSKVYDKITVITDASRRSMWNLKTYVPTNRLRHTSINDLLRKLFKRCRTKDLVLSLDDDWISPIMGGDAYLQFLNLNSLEVGFAEDHEYNPMSMTTTLALVLSNNDLTNLTLRNFSKPDPKCSPHYENCTIPNLLQHSSLTHLTLRNADITELDDAPSLSTTSKIKFLDIGTFSGGAKPETYQRAVGKLVEAVTKTLEELSLDVCPNISTSHKPFVKLRTLRLGPAIPVKSVTPTLQAFITDGKSDLHELEIRGAKDSQGDLISALKAIKSGTFPSVRKITLRFQQGDDETVQETSREGGDAGGVWDSFVGSL